MSAAPMQAALFGEPAIATNIVVAVPGLQPPTFGGLDMRTEGNGRAWAVFSTDRRYRYLLGRCLTANPIDAMSIPALVVGMINPSSAGAYKPAVEVTKASVPLARISGESIDNDPTVTKLIGFGRRLGCGRLIVCNLAALVSTDPKGLAAVEDPIGPHNATAIEWAFRHPTTAIAMRVAAWGRPPSKRVRERLKGSMLLMQQFGALWCWGKTAEGEPRHPLMLAYDTPLVSMVDGRPWS